MLSRTGGPPLNYPLYLGSLNSKTVTCGFHYAKFAVTTGKVLSSPAKESLTTFKVKTEGSAVLVELDR
jgi:nitrite reductase/ring-hydroxylating ferredoxin subunit